MPLLTTFLRTLPVFLLLLAACDAGKSGSAAPAPLQTTVKTDGATSNPDGGTSDAAALAAGTGLADQSRAADTANTSDTAKSDPAPGGAAALASNRLLDEIIALLPRARRTSEVDRGYWHDNAFSPTFETGFPAVRVAFASKESRTLDMTQESGFGVIKEDQSATLVVISADAKADALEKTLSDAMTKLGYQAQSQRLIGGVSEPDETLTFWAMDKGAVYLAREGDLVLYSIESDSGQASSSSFGAQQIFLFKAAWKSR